MLPAESVSTIIYACPKNDVQCNQEFVFVHLPRKCLCSVFQRDGNPNVASSSKGKKPASGKSFNDKLEEAIFEERMQEEPKKEEDSTKTQG